MKPLSKMNRAEKIAIGREAEALYKKVIMDTTEGCDLPENQDNQAFWAERFPDGYKTDIQMQNSFFKNYCKAIADLNLPEEIHIFYFLLGKKAKEKLKSDSFLRMPGEMQ